MVLQSLLIRLLVRGGALTFILISIYYYSMSHHLGNSDLFFTVGICTAYILVCVGLMADAALSSAENERISTFLLVIGAILFLMSGVLASYRASKEPEEFRRKEIITCVVLSGCITIMFSVDVLIRLC